MLDSGMRGNGGMRGNDGQGWGEFEYCCGGWLGVAQ